MPAELAEEETSGGGDKASREALLDNLPTSGLAILDFETVDWDDVAFRRGRLVLLTTKGDQAYHRFAFRPDDTLLLGRETAGVPEAVHRAADARLRIPLQPGRRSLNLAVAAAMVLGEALRQTDGLPRDGAA